jgi:flagellar protein FliJ
MAQFKFKLSTVLRQRENEEHILEGDLARAIRHQLDLEAQVLQIEAQITQCNQTMREQHLTGPLDPQTLLAHRRFLAAAKLDVFKLADQISRARIDVESARRKLAEAAKNRKAIETLRDKQKSRWIDDQNRKELAAADDVATQIAYTNLMHSQSIGHVA